MTATVAYTTTEISLAKLIPCPSRRSAHLGQIEALAISAKANRLLQFLVVRSKRNSTFGDPLLLGQQFHDGQPASAGGNLVAVASLSVTGIPCYVLDANGVAGAEVSLAENVIHREHAHG